MNTLYICGDSYGVSDWQYGQCWVDILTQKISDRFNVVNLSKVCASNLQISTQIDFAISKKADFIIYLMTSSTREDVTHKQSVEKNIFKRYTDISNQTLETDLTSYSIFSLDHTTILSENQLALLRQYHGEFFDMDLTIYKNEIIIEGILSRLAASNIPFIYDQGGFENTKFSNTIDKIYFKNYLKHKSAINLWNFTHGKKHRPYYHIEDLEIHKNVADYYLKLIYE